MTTDRMDNERRRRKAPQSERTDVFVPNAYLAVKLSHTAVPTLSGTEMIVSEALHTVYDSPKEDFADPGSYKSSPLRFSPLLETVADYTYFVESTRPGREMPIMYGENDRGKKNKDDSEYDSEYYTTGRYDTICGERIVTFNGKMRFRVCNDGMVWFDTGDPMLPSVPICEGKRFLLGDMPELDFLLSLTDRIESTVPRYCTTQYARNDLGENGGKLEFCYVIETFGSEIETMRCELSVFPTGEMHDFTLPTSYYVPDGIQDRS